MRPIASVITISPEAPHFGTGMQAGGHGSETPESLKIAGWLAGHIPADVDKALASRASSHGVELKIKFEGRYPTSQNGARLPSYLVAVGCECIGDKSNRTSALADARKFLTPAPTRAIEEWLAELSVIVAKRREDEFSDALRITAYASRLAGYPADVVRYALLRRTWQFWPTWAELETVCEAQAGPRRAMVAALAHPAPEPVPERRPATAEERARITAMVDELFPSATKEMREKATTQALVGDRMRKAS